MKKTVMNPKTMFKNDGQFTYVRLDYLGEQYSGEYYACRTLKWLRNNNNGYSEFSFNFAADYYYHDALSCKEEDEKIPTQEWCNKKLKVIYKLLLCLGYVQREKIDSYSFNLDKHFYTGWIYLVKTAINEPEIFNLLVAFGRQRKNNLPVEVFEQIRCLKEKVIILNNIGYRALSMHVGEEELSASTKNDYANAVLQACEDVIKVHSPLIDKSQEDRANQIKNIITDFSNTVTAIRVNVKRSVIKRRNLIKYQKIKFILKRIEYRLELDTVLDLHPYSDWKKEDTSDITYCFNFRIDRIEESVIKAFLSGNYSKYSIVCNWLEDIKYVCASKPKTIDKTTEYGMEKMELREKYILEVSKLRDEARNDKNKGAAWLVTEIDKLDETYKTKVFDLKKKYIGYQNCSGYIEPDFFFPHD